jgi:poly-gamma-glutamate capsule biosynthesis protein CapA/YwtB (metallophosphatase superfamily)
MIASASLSSARPVRLFLCGDVMIGRGIDQILPHPSDPILHESYARSALDYVRFAEAADGPIPRRIDPSYIWGVALDELNRMQPDARIINLETSVTKSDDYVAKGINYRMSPENAVCLKAAAIDCCVLANNHVLDWGRGGLLDTLNTLARLDIKTAGAGCNCGKAGAPAVLDVAGNRRLLVFSFANPTSGTPRGWTASNHDAGVNILAEISEEAAERVAAEIARHATPSDLTIVSIHWGPNWGYEIAEEQRRFAHGLIERAGVAILHGHSSHHPKGIEVHRNRLILYGCGDFLNDYEGIKGYEPYRDDLVLMYFPEIDPAGNLNALDRVPLQIRNFRLVRPAGQDVAWMQKVLDRESRKFGVAVTPTNDGRFSVSWKRSSGTE